MKCPNCNVDLVMSERAGVEIDYCPQCRGVWLDRGELDKIIDRTNQEVSRQERSNEAPRVSYSEERYQGSKGEDRGYYDEHNNYRKKKRGGLLGDLFDFGD